MTDAEPATGGEPFLARVLGSNIARHRKARGWTLDRLAREAGWTRSSITRLSAIEAGAHRPRATTLRKIADALGVPVTELTSVYDPARRPETSSLH